MNPPALIFRPADPAFASVYATLINRCRDHISPYFPKTLAAVQDEASAEVYLKSLQTQAAQRTFFSFIVFEKETDIPVGGVMIKSIDWRIPMCEMAYFIDPDHTRKGIGSKAMEIMVNYAFDQFKMEKIFLRIAPENIASMRLAEKLGFIKEGQLRSAFRISPTELKDVNYMGLLRQEWQSRK